MEDGLGLESRMNTCLKFQKRYGRTILIPIASKVTFFEKQQNWKMIWKMVLKLGSAFKKGIIWNMDCKVVSAFLSLRMHAAIMKCSEVKIKLRKRSSKCTRLKLSILEVSCKRKHLRGSFFNFYCVANSDSRLISSEHPKLNKNTW